MSATGGVTGIVLAGGRASRFGSDKLVAPVAGRPLLHLAIKAVAEVADEIVVVLSPDRPPPALPERVAPPILFVRDIVAGRGPLAGLAAGLAAARQPRSLLVAGDQPFLLPDVLRALVDELDLAGPDATGLLGAEAGVGPPDVVVLADGGHLWPFPVALRTATVRPAAAAALDGGDLRLFTLFGRLRLAHLPEARWRALDPGGASLRDIDTRDDLPGG